MSVTQRQGVITCIPKEGKDKRFLKNWRPITLLNTVYKIASSCISERIKLVLPSIIHSDQKGFMKGRNIGENIRLLYDTIIYAKERRVNGLLLMIDFEKAFDSISWSFVQKALVKFNFGNDIRRWVSTFYHNTKSCVRVNGQYSEWFVLQRGTRQGDPLSPYLFLICAEIMANMIRQNPSIHGLNIFDEEILLSQYADDTTFFLDGTRECFCACITTLHHFASLSGLTINYDKSSAVWVGPLKNSNVRYLPEYNFAWNPATFKVLGIVFSLDTDNIVLLNYDSKLLEIKRIFNSWSRRNLTPFGKITVIKTLALSKLTFLFLNLPDPDDDFLGVLQKMLFSFIWNGKPDRIKRTIMYQPYEEGGLRMVNVKDFLSALKITSLKKIIQDDGKITKILFALCPDVKNVKLRGGEFANVLMERLVNPFWVDVFKHYKNFCSKCIPLSFDDFASECLFYNINICRDRNVVYLRSWAESGITTVGHLCNQNGFLTFAEFKNRYPNVYINFVLYEGIVRAVKNYQDKLGLVFCESFSIEDAFVWKCICKSGSKHIYNCLVKHSERPKCIDKWTERLQVNLEINTIFTKLKKTTQDTRLRWFQYRLIYRILPTQRFLFLRNIADSSVCTFCGKEEETLEHLFWDCTETQIFWTHFLDWLHCNFFHCANMRLSRHLVLFGCQDNVITDKAFDLFLLIAKNQIFSAKVKGVTPNMLVLIRTLKQRYVIEKQNAYLNDYVTSFHRNWDLYSHYFH